MAYQRIPAAGLMVVGLVSKKESFQTAETLVRRSMILGVSILLVAIAFTFFFSRGLTQRLRQLWHATKKVSQGEFTIRVDASRGKDEISDLAASFNTMADRIDELMAETAEKARMEKELETAQAVQTRFFPLAGLSHSSISVSGKALPATECAGDWWQYARIGKYLVVALGDVTGHGVSSALVTAAAYGAFSISVRELRLILEKNSECMAPPAVAIIEKLVLQMNTAVQAAGAGQTTMTMVLSLVNVETGEMMTFNAAHRPVYVYRKTETDVKKQLLVLADGRMPAMGDEIVEIPEPKRTQLQAGDVIYWYTDGLVECINGEGVRMNKNALLKMMTKAADESSERSDLLCEKVLMNFTEFLGSNAKNPDDDITLAVGVVPTDAKFVKEG